MRDEACIFCKIFNGELSAQEVVRTADVLVFRDLTPHAPTHLLVIPKRHATDLGAFVAAAPANEGGDLCAVAPRAGRAASPGGNRTVATAGADAGQTVFHLHLHVLAGRSLGWPPG